MLSTLCIKHLVLVESCELHFSSGFTVLTGETGAGKSLFLTAIGLLLGEKAEISLVRHGETMGYVEGTFTQIPPLSLLEELGIEGSEITIRRELHAKGKSKAFINNHLVPLGHLKIVAPSLIEISDQHASLSLKKTETPQVLIDLFGKTTTLRASFQKSYTNNCFLKSRLDMLLNKSTFWEKEQESLSQEIEKIEKVIHTDDNTLFSSLQKIEQTKETLSSASQLLSQLDSSYGPLHFLAKEAEKISSLDSTFSDISEYLQTACTAIRNGINALNTSLHSIEYSEEERLLIETQVREIDSIQRTYGTTQDKLLNAHQALKERVLLIEKEKKELFNLEESIESESKLCNNLAQQLRDIRKERATILSLSIQSHLHTLNMPHARFEVAVSHAKRSVTGDDNVSFLLTPNVGEKTIHVKDHASGGELARIFLALQTILYSEIPTVIFDEIDSSIGGQTAHAVGELLAQLGNNRQVFTITHFVQVAKNAQTHFKIEKKVHNGRTMTVIQKLSLSKEKDLEHRRMVGEPCKN